VGNAKTDKMQADYFKIINEIYRKKRAKLLIEGKSQRPTKLGYWGSSNPEQIFELFTKIKLEKYKNFVDLGSGDGVVAAIAALFTGSTGIESDEKLHKEATAIRKELIDKKKVKINYEIKNENYFDADFSGYDFMFINPDNYFHKLEKKIIEEFKGVLIVTESIFQPLTLRPSEKISVRGAEFNVYNLR
jgi:predicted O-methyltransferase YrrM